MWSRMVLLHPSTSKGRAKDWTVSPSFLAKERSINDLVHPLSICASALLVIFLSKEVTVVVTWKAWGCVFLTTHVMILSSRTAFSTS